MQARYRYNSSGWRIRSQVGSVVTRTVRDGARALGDFDAGGFVRHWNLSGGLGRLGISGSTERSALRYYYSDHLGSLRAVATSAGTVVEVRDYDPWGLELPGRSRVEGVKTREGYTGYELDEETGLNYAGARYYDPAIGRWFVTDPMKEYASPYIYVGNNPVNRVDPTGMFSTHTDSTGKVIAVYDDDDLGVYVHEGSADDIRRKTQGCQAERNTSCGGTRLGHTLSYNSFRIGNQINFIDPEYGTNMIINYYNKTRGLDPLFYGLRAKDGGELDVKSHENIGGYNRIDGTNLIVSPRDVGNIVAGMYARDNHVFGGSILAAFGVFNNLNTSRDGSRTVNAMVAGMTGISTMLAPPHQAVQMQSRMFLMEDPVTIKAIIYGYFIRDR